jgi:hypothetical protein
MMNFGESGGEGMKNANCLIAAAKQRDMPAEGGNLGAELFRLCFSCDPGEI